jgi:small neutral amino acid transporter SnatA (MarC family)
MRDGGKGTMTGFFKGPSLLVHILIAAMVNALAFPLFYRWAGSILYAFLISVCVLCMYGGFVVWLFRRKN